MTCYAAPLASGCLSDLPSQPKAVIEIRSLYEKIDHFIFKQCQRLIAVKEIQTELIGELSEKLQARGLPGPGEKKESYRVFGAFFLSTLMLRRA